MKQKRKIKIGKWNKTHGAAKKREMEYLLRVAREKDRFVKYDPT